MCQRKTTLAMNANCLRRKQLASYFRIRVNRERGRQGKSRLKLVMTGGGPLVECAALQARKSHGRRNCRHGLTGWPGVECASRQIRGRWRRRRRHEIQIVRGAIGELHRPICLGKQDRIGRLCRVIELNKMLVERRIRHAKLWVAVPGYCDGFLRRVGRRRSHLGWCHHISGRLLAQVRRNLVSVENAGGSQPDYNQQQSPSVHIVGEPLCFLNRNSTHLSMADSTTCLRLSMFSFHQ